MADNTTISPGVGGDTIKTEDIGSYKFAVSKIYVGAHGVDGGAVTPGNPFPVTVGNFPGNQVVSGSVTALVATGGNSLAIDASGQIAVQSGGSPGSTAPGRAIQVGGTDGANLRALSLSSAGVITLPSLPAGTNTIGAVSNTAFVANAGTNLNTSALALETGGNLATLAGKDFATQTTLSSLNGKVTACNTGAVVVAALPSLPAGSNAIGTVTANAGTGTFAVSAASLPLPSGAAQDATLTGGGQKAQVVAASGTAATVTAANALKVDGSAVTQPVSLAALPALPTGANTIGSVNVANATISGALPSGTNNIGIVIAGERTDALYSGSTAITPQFAPINLQPASAGNNTIVAAVAGKSLRVIRYRFTVSAATVATWLSSGGSTISGAETIAANSGEGAPFCPLGVMQSAVGEGLVLNSSAAVSIGGSVTYIQI